jgi:hypothetical protein
VVEINSEALAIHPILKIIIAREDVSAISHRERCKSFTNSSHKSQYENQKTSHNSQGGEIVD